MTRYGVWICVFCVLGCGDDDDPGVDAATDIGVELDVGADAQDDVGFDSSTPMTITIRALGGPDAVRPFDGLRVFAGTTMVGTTDTAGELDVTLTPDTPVTVEYVGSQTTYTSLVAYDDAVPKDGETFIIPILQPRDDLDLVTITGTIVNAPAETDVYVLGVDVPGAQNNLANGDPSPNFEATLPRQDGAVDFIMGTGENLEDPLPSPRGFHRAIGVAAVTSVDATTDRSDVVIDADPGADGVALTDISGSFAVPSGNAFFEMASANVLERSAPFNGAGLGGLTRLFFDETSNAFQWEGVRIPVEPGVTTFSLSQGARFSQVSIDGAGDGDQGQLEFYPPPNITSPGFDENVSPGGQVVFDNVPSDAYVSLFLVNGEDFLWWVLSGNASEVTIPELPSDATSVLEGDDVRFRPRYCESSAEPACPRVSFGLSAGAEP